MKKNMMIPEEIADIEALMAEVARADASVRQLTARMDAEMTKVREKYAQALELERSRRQGAEELLESWASLNKEAFGARRSMKLTHGVMGWRLGTPALRLRARIKAEMAFERVKQYLPEFVRVKHEVNKEALLAAHAGKQVTDEQIIACGYQVSQTERFYVEPKTEEEA